MKKLQMLIGDEHALDQVTEELRGYAERLAAPVVGALDVSCSDETEVEAIATFQQGFVDPLLPALKDNAKSPFRTCNLGARYEWGSVRVAEHHYALPAARDAFKLLVVKINGHVAVQDAPDGPRFGPLQRYDTASTACGALHALLRGDDLPALTELRALFNLDGKDRVAALTDGSRVAERHRYLFAALASARLHARRALEDIRLHKPETPTMYLVVPCVTLNRPGPDTEIVVGLQTIDTRESPPAIRYQGLGDDPARYRAELSGGRLSIREAQHIA